MTIEGGVRVYFTKNGRYLGEAFSIFAPRNSEVPLALYPVVGLDSTSTTVDVNFGFARPFSLTPVHRRFNEQAPDREAAGALFDTVLRRSDFEEPRAFSAFQ